MAILDNILAYWPLDEASGSATDAGGAMHDLTDNNACGSTTGKVGNARTFLTGLNQSLSSSSGNLELGEEDWTAVCWFQTSFDGGTIVSQYGSTGSPQWGWVLDMLNGAGQVSFTLTNSSGSIAFAEFAGNMADGNWHFVCWWYDSAGDNIYIQIDNGTPVSAAAAFTMSAAPYLFVVGGKDASFSATGNFLGNIDEVGIWQRVLDSGERSLLWNSGAGLAYPFIGGGGGGGGSGVGARLINGGLIQ